MMTSIQLNQYLSKLGVACHITVDLDGLRKLHKCQHRRIPFENFDVAAGRAIRLGLDNLFEKLVLSERGGYCFEVNGLLLHVLQAVGFDGRALLARVHLSGEPSGRTHQVSLITLNDQRWIVDAGFGSQTPRQPLLLEVGQEQHIDYQTFRFIAEERYGFMLQVKRDNEWFDLYSLDLSFVCQGDIECGNHYTSTSQHSVFTSATIAALPIENGMITLLDNTLKITQGDSVVSIEAPFDDRYAEQVKKHFNIDMEAHSLKEQ
ncbi:arylamine N-acetyltransferase [Vibrio sp. ZSDZ65]|uniref:Arylamine N-acetyltransferase n=1 Tax=Vibrio qingdaonensis TaxID=2829491 RepID=A0A9X3CL45_9VIBR|nr:arylamine N-acetyltransferase [Vibrio qingdaonensis]MCW8345256.1 arylamine N-acetyltransferase [Vibrio qingdaonensis]